MKNSKNWSESIYKNLWQMTQSFFFVYGVIAFLATLYAVFAVSGTIYSVWTHQGQNINVISSDEIQIILNQAGLDQLKTQGEIQSFGSYGHNPSGNFEIAAFDLDSVEPNQLIANQNERWYRGDETNSMLSLLGKTINDCVDSADSDFKQSCFFPKKDDIHSDQYYIHFIELALESSLDRVKGLKVILVCPQENRAYYIHIYS